MTIPAEPALSADSATGVDAGLARRWPLLVLMLLLPIWSIGLFHRGIWMPDEPREYDIACNMLHSGDLITPRLAGDPFLEKPPLAYWAQSASMRVFGPSTAAARLPNLLWAALAVLCTGMLAGDMALARERSRAALFAALICGTMILVLQVQIWLATDAPLLAMTATALLTSWRLGRAVTSRQKVGWSLLLGASLAGAFLAKNGFGLLVPGLAVAGWLTWERRLHQLLRWPWWAAAGWFALFAGGWLIALADQHGGRDQLHALLWDNLAARALPVHAGAGYDPGHRSSHWKFLLLLPVYALPWSFALLGAARWSARSLRPARASGSAVRFCVTSVVPPCVVLLSSRTARDVYFAPALLGLPVLLALWLTTRSDRCTGPERFLLRLTRRALEVLAVLFACAAAFLLTLTGIHDVSLAALIALIPPVLAGTCLSLRVSHRSAHGILASTGAFLLALGTFAVLAFPTIDRAENLSALVAQAAPRLNSGLVVLYCGDETIRATLDYTAGLRLQNVCTTEGARELLLEHGDLQFFVEIAPARSAQRVKELFPTVDTSRWKSRKPRTVKRLADLTGLGLQPTAVWSVPGGRKYALYGRAHPGAAAQISAASADH